jgi:hypothetical protein
MRILRFGISYVLLNIFALLVFALLAQNARPEHLTYFGITFSVNFAWILLGSATFGMLLSLLLLLPGRIALTFHAWGLDQEAEQLERQVAQLRSQREDLLDRHEALLEGQERALRRYYQLLAEHREVVAERDRARAQLGPMSAPLPERVEERESTPTAWEEKISSSPSQVERAWQSRRLLPSAVS